MNEKNLKHYRLIILFVFGSFFIVNSIFILFPGILDIFSLRLNDRLFDLRNSIKGPEPIWSDSDENGSVRQLITLIELDDRGYDKLDELRQQYGDLKFDANLINILSDVDVEAIAYDTVFANEGGVELIGSTKKAGNVYYPLILAPANVSNRLTLSKEVKKDLWNIKVMGKSPEEYQLRYSTKPELLKEAKGASHININPDNDGIYRRIPLLIRTRDGYLPSLGLRLATDYLDVGPNSIEVVFGKQIVLKNAKYPDGNTKDIKIPIDEQGQMIINFADKWLDAYSHIAFVDIFQVLDDEDLLDVLREKVEGNFVIVADVSSAGKDFEAVPIEKDYPLSSVHANVLNSILTENFIKELSGWQVILINVLFAIFMYLLAIKTRAFIFLSGTALLFLIYTFFVISLFIIFGTMMNSIPAALGIAFSFIFVSVYRYLKEEQEKALLYQTFESYFAPSVMNKIISNPEKLESSERKNLTILFTDISGFTAWSSTREPEEIHSTLNEYFAEMARIVFKYEGTIDKYMGDGMLTFFGDPVEYDDHALRAVKSAIDMQRRAKNLSDEWAKKGKLKLQMRIGINTGDVVVGNMGSKDRIEYTVLGSNVNLAQRLESNAPLGGILISKSVYDEIIKEKDTDPGVLNDVEIKKYASLSLKGFTEDIQVYEITI